MNPRKTIVRILAAVALGATPAVVSGFAPPAMAATPLKMTGESLVGTGTWTPKQGCVPAPASYCDGTFTVSGTATGPYPGTFVESGQFQVSLIHGGGGWYGPATFAATFTVTSGAMAPITGNLSGQGTGFHCGPVGCNTYRLSNFAVSYTLTDNYSGGEPAGWPASGALVNATFRLDTLVASITENFA